MDEYTNVWLFRGYARQVKIPYGKAKPLPSEVRRTIFTEDGHVPYVAVDMPFTGRDFISHMDATRLYHLLKTGYSASSEMPVAIGFLSKCDIAQVKQSCFLLAKHL